MSRATVLGWPCCKACITAWQMCAMLSRLLLLLAAVEVITMPLTQHFWTWDRFLHGGQDFELGLLTVVACLCLVLLHAQKCRQGLDLFLTIRRLLLRIVRSDTPYVLLRDAGHGRPAPAPLNAPGSLLYSAPLQI